MKKSILSIILFTLTLTAHALPGFTSFIPDNSGEYVYYRDYTFTRESYVGILYYDESTVQVRYFAPQDNETLLPQKNIAILMSINPDAPYWEMTGERIISTILPGTEDTDLVNYLHDLMYEFSAHRIKADEINARDVKIFQDYEQFGGSVAMIYDCIIPLFNIKNIESADGMCQLQCCTIGQLKNSSDPSFDTFEGCPDSAVPAAEKKSTQKSKKAKSVKCTFENQSITLDENWKPLMENLWGLGNDSIVTLGTIPSFDSDPQKNECYILRRLLESTDHTYTNFATLKISNNKNKTEIDVETFQSDSEKRIKSIKLLANKKNADGIDILSISIFTNAWNENPAYYQKIIKSYSN